MSLIPILIQDLLLLRLGSVLLGSTVARLCSSAQLLGGQVLGSSVCYEFIVRMQLGQEQIPAFEEVFRRLCSEPLSFRLIRQPRANAILWARETRNSFFARVLEERTCDSILQMVELDGRFDFVEGPVADDPLPLRAVRIELERGFASFLPAISCYRLRAVFPSSVWERKMVVRQEKTIKEKENFFLYNEERRTAIPRSKGLLLMRSILDWSMHVFQKEGFLFVLFDSTSQKTRLPKGAWNDSFFSSHLDVWRAAGCPLGWSGATFRHLHDDKVPSSSAWGLFCLEWSHVLFSSSFCTKQDLVLELRRVFCILLRLVSSLGVRVSFRAHSSADVSASQLQDFWDQVESTRRNVLDVVGRAQVAEYSWMGIDAIGRFWHLGRVRFAPLPRSLQCDTGEAVWWVCFEPLGSMESLSAFLCLGGGDALLSVPRRIRLFT
ncbi:hypothetical protein, partial [Candidatus Similichlamydia epinepheli]|uniref:hypothetical protein n=1 Tax=Candidatus Similichlamydia epinepheli TaxID=1903953 RepID=UPI0013001D11